MVESVPAARGAALETSTTVTDDGLVRTLPHGWNGSVEALDLPEDAVVNLRAAEDASAPPVALREQDAGANPVEIVVPYAGDALSGIAVSPPSGTVMLLSPEPAAGEDVVAGLRHATETQEELILPYAGGPLPEEALQPPEGVVVKLRAVTAD